MVRAAVGKSRPVEFPVPAGVERARIDPETGLLAYEGMEGALELIAVEIVFTDASPHLCGEATVSPASHELLEYFVHYDLNVP